VIFRSLPFRDAGRLTRLLCDQVESIDPGFGIEIMTLTAVLAEPLPGRQTASTLVAEADIDISGLIDTLANRIGEHRLYRIAPVASDVPERFVRRIAPLPAADHAEKRLHDAIASTPGSSSWPCMRA